MHSWNPERNLHKGGNSVAFGSVGSAPNVSDEASGRRTGNHEDYKNLIRLGHVINTLHFWPGYPVEPIDLHPSVRHLDSLYDLLALSDRFVHAYSLGRQRNVDGIDMVKIARQVDEDTFQREPSIMTVINANSPLVYDTPMLQGIIEFSSRNQVVCITPFTLAGAMAPVTIAGALAQHNAEALAGIAFTQVVRPGAPVIYGGFTSNVDMQSGAPAFGTPEYIQTAMITGCPGVFYYLGISLPLDYETLDPHWIRLHTGPAFFGLATNPKLLDVVESVIGPEIALNPVQQTRMKPPQRLLSSSLAEYSNVGPRPGIRTSAQSWTRPSKPRCSPYGSR